MAAATATAAEKQSVFLVQLIVAIRANDVDVVKRILPHTDVNSATANGWTLLHHACDDGRAEIVDLLLQVSGIDVNKVDINGRTPLYIARMHRCTNIANMLIGAGADINKSVVSTYPREIDTWKSIDDQLIDAIKENDIDTFKKLFSSNAIDVNAVVGDDRETLLYIACQDHCICIIEMLLRVPGIDVNKANEDGTTPLFVACRHGRDDIVEILLAAGADMNKDDGYGCTALYDACIFGRTRVVKILLDTGIKNASDKKIPFDVARLHRYPEIFELLVDARQKLLAIAEELLPPPPPKMRRKKK